MRLSYAFLAGLLVLCGCASDRLATRSDFGSVSRMSYGTGFVVDKAGQVLTAEHVVRGCSNIYVSKGTRVLQGKLIGRSRNGDLALLGLPEPLAPPAVFATEDRPIPNGLVFVAGYEALRQQAEAKGSLFNGVVTSASQTDAEIALVSDAEYGASGAAVMDAGGLVIGLVTRRTRGERVMAAGVGVIRRFLTEQSVVVESDSRAQLGVLQDRARRAGTFTVGIHCFKP